MDLSDPSAVQSLQIQGRLFHLEALMLDDYRGEADYLFYIYAQ